jgi:hypothetical protein
VDKPTELTQERVLRFQVAGGSVEVRYLHRMSAEDARGLIDYLEVWERHLMKSEAAPPIKIENTG